MLTFLYLLQGQQLNREGVPDHIVQLVEHSRASGAEIIKAVEDLRLGVLPDDLKAEILKQRPG